MVAGRAGNVLRWRVRDNMPGSRDFCPIIVRSESVQEIEKYDCAKALNDLEVEFGADVLLRSAVWLTVTESSESQIARGNASATTARWRAFLGP